MEVEYVLEEDDYVAAQRYCINRLLDANVAFFRRNWVLLVLCLFLGFIFILTSLMDQQGIYWRNFILGVCALSAPVILFLFRHPLAEYQMRRMIRRRPEALGMIGLAVYPEGITSSKHGSSSTTMWPMVDSIQLSDSHAFFLLPARAILILPKRAFSSEETYNRFVAEAQRFHNRTRSGGGRESPEQSAPPSAGIQSAPGLGDTRSTTGILREKQAPPEGQPGSEQ